MNPEHRAGTRKGAEMTTSTKPGIATTKPAPIVPGSSPLVLDPGDIRMGFCRRHNRQTPWRYGFKGGGGGWVCEECIMEAHIP